MGLYADRWPGDTGAFSKPDQDTHTHAHQTVSMKFELQEHLTDK